jgi:hypothetical protein
VPQRGQYGAVGSRGAPHARQLLGDLGGVGEARAAAPGGGAALAVASGTSGGRTLVTPAAPAGTAAVGEVAPGGGARGGAGGAPAAGLMAALGGVVDGRGRFGRPSLQPIAIERRMIVPKVMRLYGNTWMIAKNPETPSRFTVSVVDALPKYPSEATSAPIEACVPK